MTSAKPRINITKALKDRAKQEALEKVMDLPEYKEIQTLREQCAFIYYESKKYIKNTESTISYYDIGTLISCSATNVGYLIKRHLQFLQGEIQDVGRPPKLNESEIKAVKEWLTQEIPPKLVEVSEFCNQNFGKKLEYKSIMLLLEKIGFKAVEAKPIEEKRYEVSQDAIIDFMKEIDDFAKENDVPSFMCFNMDEEGHDTYSDAHDNIVVVPIDKVQSKNGAFFYPVERKPNHATFLACVNAYGDYFKPLIICKRKTVDEGTLVQNIGPSKLYLSYSEKGYITKTIFDEWLKQVFEPEIQKLRASYGYQGPGMVLLDGCTAHKTDLFFEICKRNNIQYFFFPPHSSNQLQPLDLGIFAVHKHYVKKIDIDHVDTESEITKTIVNLYGSWERTNTTTNNQNAWRAMGAKYSLGGPQGTTKIRFEYQNSMKRLNEELSYQDRKALKVNWLSKFCARVPISTYNAMFTNKIDYKKLYKSKNSSSTTPETSENSSSTTPETSENSSSTTPETSENSSTSTPETSENSSTSTPETSENSST